MDMLKYSIVTMGKQDKGWSEYNGPESEWCWIRIDTKDGDSGGVTSMGPYRTAEAKSYIQRIAYPKSKGFWKRLFNK